MEIRPILSALMRSKTGAVLVAVQVAISLAILANALHIVNVRQAVAARPSGVAAENDVFYVNIQNLNRGSHERQLAEQKRQAALLRALPGVMSVAQTSQAVLSRSGHLRAGHRGAHGHTDAVADVCNVGCRCPAGRPAAHLGLPGHAGDSAQVPMKPITHTYPL